MPVPTDMVGDRIGPIRHEVDTRWIMAYAAALGDTQDCYFDTRRASGIVAHPMFAVCPEWPVIVQGRELADKWGITPEETRQSVHATHDLTVHRLPKPGDVLDTHLTYTGVENKSPGAYTTMRIETFFDANGDRSQHIKAGCTWGVPAEGDDRPAQDDPAVPELGPLPTKSSSRVAGSCGPGSCSYLYRIGKNLEPHTHRCVRSRGRWFTSNHSARNSYLGTRRQRHHLHSC